MVILQKKIPKLSAAALERFASRARRAAKVKGTVNILVTSSAAVQTLNRRFLGKNSATDVLSFPPNPSVSHNPLKLAGEVSISADIAAQNAHRMGHSVAEEVKVLTLHGILHLAGFDHERDNGEMARKELRLRRALKLPVGLIERTARAQEPSAHRRHREREAERE